MLLFIVACDALKRRQRRIDFRFCCEAAHTKTNGSFIDCADAAMGGGTKTKLFGKKVSFGTADSRLEIPAQMSHATNSESCLAAKRINNATVRISVGLENTEDLIEDLTQALL